MNPAAQTRGTPPKNAHSPDARNPMGSPRRMPRTLSFGPPQAPVRNPPSAPPMPAADWTMAKADACCPVRARTMGATSGLESDIRRLDTEKIDTSDNRGTRSRMYRKPNVISRHSDSRRPLSRTVAGMATTARAAIAIPKVVMSITMMPVM